MSAAAASSSASTRATMSAETGSRPWEIAKPLRRAGGALPSDSPFGTGRSAEDSGMRQPADQAMPAPRTPTYTE